MRPFILMSGKSQVNGEKLLRCHSCLVYNDYSANLSAAQWEGIHYMVSYTLLDECSSEDEKTPCVRQSAQTLPIYAQPDVVVAGGGPGGLAAAITAARAGAHVLLIERHGFLGGVATAAMMPAFVASGWAAGLGREVLDRLAKEGGAPVWDNAPGRTQTTPFDPETMKQVALDMVEEAGVELLLYTQAVDAMMSGSDLFGVVIENKGGRQAITARVVIDATGDADLAVRAGAAYQKGRSQDSRMRPMALLFRLGGVNLDETMAYLTEHPEEIQPQFRQGTVLRVGNERVLSRLSGFNELVDKARARGELDPNCYYFRLETGWFERGIVTVNTTRVYNVDGTDARDLTRAEIAARRQIAQLVAFARKYIPGCQHAYLLDTAPGMGVRETRRIVGDYTLTIDDVYADRRFKDSILALRQRVPRPLPANWDVHGPDPGEGAKSDPLEWAHAHVPSEPHTYELPYRCLLPRGVGNLLMAGRTIAVDHFIDGFTRNMLICMLFGEAAGLAAALAAAQRVAVRDVEISQVQEHLTAHGIHVRH